MEITAKAAIEGATVIACEARLQAARTAWLALSDRPRAKACKAAYEVVRKADGDYESALFVAHCR